MSYRVPIEYDLPAVIPDDTPKPKRARVPIEYDLPAVIKPRHRVLIEDSDEPPEPQDDIEALLPTIIDEIVNDPRSPSRQTSRPISKATLRKRRQREREAQQKTTTAAQQTTFDEIPDWVDFLNADTLPRKGGFERSQIARVVLKEVFDNALDEGPAVEYTYDAETHTYVISDNGRGIDPAMVARLFCVNRAMASTKRFRHLPLRGMLGNGLRVVMGAVCAYQGTIAVTTRGHRLSLRVNKVTGMTEVVADEAVADQPGTKVEISLSVFTGMEERYVQQAIAASGGNVYTGPARPEWFDATDLGLLLRRNTTVAEVLADIFGIESDDRRPANSLTDADVARLHEELLKDG
jgi:hypothetical protein